MTLFLWYKTFHISPGIPFPPPDSAQHLLCTCAAQGCVGFGKLSLMKISVVGQSKMHCYCDPKAACG